MTLKNKTPEIKFGLMKFPANFEGFSNWRLSTRSALRTSGVRLKLAKKFIKIMEV